MQNAKRKSEFPDAAAHSHRFALPRATRRGFTLLELVLTMVITGLLLSSLTVIVMSTAEVKVKLESETRARKMGPAILEIIARDLRNAWATSKSNAKAVKTDSTDTSGTGTTTDGSTTSTDATGAADVGVEGTFFKGEHKGGDDDAKDELWFVTSVDSYMRYHGIRSDLTEVGYYVKEDRDTGLSQLFRREDFSVDKMPNEGGLGVKLTDRLVSFRVWYYEKPKADDDPKAYDEVVKQGGEYEKEEWNSDDENILPYAIRIELVLDVTPLDAYNRREQRRMGVYHTLVRLPDFPVLDEKFKLYQLALPSDKPAETKKEETKK
jgi:prepilin-type N-terminal cleavage/methylation domain-containing protein